MSAFGLIMSCIHATSHCTVVSNVVHFDWFSVPFSGAGVGRDIFNFHRAVQRPLPVPDRAATGVEQAHIKFDPRFIPSGPLRRRQTLTGIHCSRHLAGHSRRRYVRLLETTALFHNLAKLLCSLRLLFDETCIRQSACFVNIGERTSTRALGRKQARNKQEFGVSAREPLLPPRDGTCRTGP